MQESDIQDILRQFPTLDAAFAYGSGVIEQGGYEKLRLTTESASMPMVDMIFVVNDSKSWHDMNRKWNPHHYTPLTRRLPVSCLSNITDNVGAGMWYNAMVS
jgi:hypothetical protein